MAKKRKKAGPKQPAAKPAAASAAPAPAVAAPAPAPAATPNTDDKPRSRGAQRRQANRARQGAAPAGSAAELGPVPEPTFWYGFEITWAKLVLARVVVFALLAIDAVTEVSHAPRYGAGDFNVAHLPLFDLIAPGRAAFAIGQLVLGYLFVLVVCGVATRIVVPLATAIYGWLYFGSQLDSYQHHYLVWLILLLSCFVPWERPVRATAATPVRSWAVRLILIQLALLYFWAAISKLNGAWLDGRTLSGQIFGTVRSMIDATIGIKAASWLVVLTELALAATVWSRRTWWIAAPLGLALHAGIAKTGLEIGVFAWLMIGIYVLVVPDRIWVWIGERLARVKFWPTRDSAMNGVGAWFLLVFGAGGVGLALALFSRFAYAVPVAIALFVVVLVGSLVWRRRLSLAMAAVAHVLALGTWMLVDRVDNTASDYYRLWGGSSRRLGDPKTSEYAYRKMTEIDPDNGQGHYQLARLLLARNADDEGIAALHRAQDNEPLRARAYIAEAKWLQSKGRTEEALQKATVAAAVEPDNAEAKSLLDSLTPK